MEEISVFWYINQKNLLISSKDITKCFFPAIMVNEIPNFLCLSLKLIKMKMSRCCTHLFNFLILHKKYKKNQNIFLTINNSKKSLKYSIDQMLLQLSDVRETACIWVYLF